MTKKNRVAIMERAHEIARGLDGDYSARLSYGLKQAWKEYKDFQDSYIKVIMPQWLFRKNGFAFGKHENGGMLISGQFIRETEKAILLMVDYGQYWLPKSQIKIISPVA